VRTIGATDTIVTIYDSAFNPLAENDDDRTTRSTPTPRA
jgi:hypothetical protein